MHYHFYNRSSEKYWLGKIRGIESSFQRRLVQVPFPYIPRKYPAWFSNPMFRRTFRQPYPLDAQTAYIFPGSGSLSVIALQDVFRKVVVPYLSKDRVLRSLARSVSYKSSSCRKLFVRNGHIG